MDPPLVRRQPSTRSPSTFHSFHRQPLAPGYSFTIDLALVHRRPLAHPLPATRSPVADLSRSPSTSHLFAVNCVRRETTPLSFHRPFASQSTGPVEVLPSFELGRHIRLSRNLSGSGILYVCTSTPSTESAKHRDPPSVRQTAQADAAEALILSVEGCLPVSPFGQGSCSG